MRQRSTTTDAIKGGLVVLMIAYHACYIAVMFKIVKIDLWNGFWWLFPRTVAAGFVALSGWNLAGKRERGGAFSAFARRSGMLALIAVAISAVTYFIFGKGFVFFGIFHLLALSSMLAYPLLGRPIAGTVVGIACLAAGLAMGGPRFDFPWLAWLGLRPEGLYPVDYLPLLPWFGFIALGAAARGFSSRIRAWLSARTEARAKSTKAPAWPSRRPGGFVSMLSAVGRRSLVVYLAHLPILYGLGWAVSALLGIGR